MTPLIDLLDLNLAWKRVKDDIRFKEVFLKSPHEINIVQQNLKAWLDSLSKQIEENNYQPNSMLICDVPKGQGQVRPASHLSINDRIVYAACIDACFSSISKAIQWSQGTIDFYYQISKDPERKYWSRNPFNCWKQFREKSLYELNINNYSYVVVVDVCGFYENIDITTLIYDLKQVGIDEAIVQLLRTCLSRWSQDNGISGKGIPQGYAASHLLSKLYLNSTDQSLKDLGYNHCHYNDDYRIFCHNEAEARKALLDISRLLRMRGLNLQAQKSEILTKNEAKLRFEGIEPILNNVRDTYLAEVLSKVNFSEPSITIQEADMLLENTVFDTPVRIIRETYKLYFLANNKPPFNKTLFHFLIKRLGKSKRLFEKVINEQYV